MRFRWPSGWSERSGLAAILLLGLGLRAALMVPGFGRLEDPDNYLILARSLADGQGFVMMGRPTAFRPPLYPLVLAPLVKFAGARLAWGVAALHLVLGGATIGLTAVAARRWRLSPAQVLIASAIVALDPVLAVQGRIVMTETMAAFLVALTLACISAEGTVGTLLGAFAFGLGTLCRPSFLPAAALAAAAALVFDPGNWPCRIRRASIFTAVVAVTLAPWAFRNARLFGEPVWTTTHGGYTLALANNETYYAEVLDGPPGAVWSGPNQQRWFDRARQETMSLSEPAADRHHAAAAVRLALARPWDFARASLARLGRFWGIAPSAAVYPAWLRLATAIWTVPLWIALALGVCRRDLWHWPRAVAPAILMAMTVVHSLFWTDLRMRAPIVPAIALIAATACSSRLLKEKPAISTATDDEHADRKKIQNPHGF